MVDYLINNELAIKYFPPELFRKVIGINFTIKELYEKLNDTDYPNLKIYKRDLTTIFDLHEHAFALLRIQMKYMNDSLTLNKLQSMIAVDTSLQFDFYTAPRKGRSITVFQNGLPIDLEPDTTRPFNKAY